MTLAISTLLDGLLLDLVELFHGLLGLLTLTLGRYLSGFLTGRSLGLCGRFLDILGLTLLSTLLGGLGDFSV